MVKVIGALSQLKPVSVLVLGDFMLDRYTRGKVRRISPEAPVSVLNVHSESTQPGGAGNVVLNLISLGARVVAVGRVGDDGHGQTLMAALSAEGADTRGFVVQRGFQTPVKNRFIADAQQVLRVDFEEAAPLSAECQATVVDGLEELIRAVDIVAISDYGKGFLTDHLLERVMVLSRAAGVPVVVDPKGLDFTKYSGATMIKPNNAEAYAAANLPSDVPLEKVAESLFKRAQIDQLMITRSEKGMTLFERGGTRSDFPVHLQEVNDVTGAGDTVLAVLSVAMASGVEAAAAARMANVAASLAIQRIGCARITLSELAECLLKSDVESKVFDDEHLFALTQALQGVPYAVLVVNSREGMTTRLFKAIRSLSVSKLLLYIEDTEPSEEFVSLIASLSEVDFVMYHSERLQQLYATMSTKEIYRLEKGNLAMVTDVTTLFKDYGSVQDTCPV